MERVLLCRYLYPRRQSQAHSDQLPGLPEPVQPRLGANQCGWPVHDPAGHRVVLDPPATLYRGLGFWRAQRVGWQGKLCAPRWNLVVSTAASSGMDSGFFGRDFVMAPPEL